MSGLGRRIPTDWKHVEKFPFSTVAPTTVDSVENVLKLPVWHWSHNQGQNGACEGFGNSMMMAVANIVQRRLAGLRPFGQRYDAWWLWDQAKLVDEWADTNPGDDNGTSGRAACDVLRTLGHVKVPNSSNERSANPQPDLQYGIAANRWATTVDEMRTAISSNLPIAIGVNWYSNFDNPVKKGGYWWIGQSALGSIRGGHCVCVYGASDRKQAFRVKNSWGRDYPLIWLPYETMQTLLNEEGESALITDR
jgi:hypothetical protein